jgi:hypothetical protein
VDQLKNLKKKKLSRVCNESSDSFHRHCFEFCSEGGDITCRRLPKETVPDVSVNKCRHIFLFSSVLTVSATLHTGLFFFYYGETTVKWPASVSASGVLHSNLCRR